MVFFPGMGGAGRLPRGLGCDRARLDQGHGPGVGRVGPALVSWIRAVGGEGLSPCSCSQIRAVGGKGFPPYLCLSFALIDSKRLAARDCRPTGGVDQCSWCVGRHSNADIRVGWIKRSGFTATAATGGAVALRLAPPSRRWLFSRACDRRERSRGFRLRLLTPGSAVLAMLLGAPVPARPGNGLLITRGHARRIRERGDSGPDGRAGQTKPEIVVAVVGGVPVAVGRTHVLWFIVPGAAPHHPGSPSARSPARRISHRKSAPGALMCPRVPRGRSTPGRSG